LNALHADVVGILFYVIAGGGCQKDMLCPVASSGNYNLYLGSRSASVCILILPPPGRRPASVGIFFYFD